ncbi:MAG TPA: hypothetical protein VF708_12145 [Pyrinomonadaceae bacterium]|jgi:hypothetical protein
MSLVKGNEVIEINETDFLDAGTAIEKWQHFPASVISSHQGLCCRIAREWVLAMDYSLLNAGDPLTGPRWLRQKYTWGASAWPIHWCEAVEQKTLDCGVLAALAREIFVARGVTSFPAQLIQQYNEEASRHWYKGWDGDETSVHWIKEDIIYHEGCAVVMRGGEIRVWDPTASWWVNPKQFGGYGGVLALRICVAQTVAVNSFTWGTHRIVPNRWRKIERARADIA